MMPALIRYLLPVLACGVFGRLPALAFDLVLPTDNKALLEGRPEDFYQFVDRTTLEGQKTTPWEGGQFGFVRDAVKLNTGEVIYTRFHEGLDIKPMHRDARDEPTDEVRSMGAGEVVHTSLAAGQSNYGKYVVVRHDWGDGPFCSLYAHLSEIRCTVGQKVEPGTVIAIMGHTGAGIDRRRAHTHTELNMFLSSHFGESHDNTGGSPNFHGNWNGMNLTGLDLAGLFLAHAKDPGMTVSAYVQKTEPYFRVAVPGSAEMEIVKNYPWLCPVPAPTTPPPSWQVTFSAWGLPLKAEPGTDAVEVPQVVWVKPSTIPHHYLSRRMLNGVGDTAKLSNDGEAYIRLACGLEMVPKALPEAPKPARKKAKK
jgi:murein DD-endopeptidase MepM/ murein hydrolase activator NlpD